jgi:hypothetical protein
MAAFVEERVATSVEEQTTTLLEAVAELNATLLPAAIGLARWGCPVIRNAGGRPTTASGLF